MTLNPLAHANDTVYPTVRAGRLAALPLSPDIEDKILRVVVDTHVHLPNMFEIVFLDESGEVATEAQLAIGSKVEVYGGAATDTRATRLITGEVTAIEAICEDMYVRTVVRGFDKSHRLQRAKRTRTFVEMTDADIAREIALGAKLKLGRIEPTKVVHQHLSQVNQTDWDFLKYRANEIGYEVGVVDGSFVFASPAFGAHLARAEEPSLTFKDNLLSFLPSLSSANLPGEVEVRMWDPQQAKVVVENVALRTEAADLSTDPAEVARSSQGPGALIPPMPPVSRAGMLGDLGPRPRPDARVVVDRPVATGHEAGMAGTELAKGVADGIGGTFAEAEGFMRGDPAVTAGRTVRIEGVPKPFVGTWRITNARHTFDDEEGGYYTRFWATGRQDRSLLGLTSLGAAHGLPPRLEGLVCGIVTNISEIGPPAGRVKIALPWLSPEYESDWVRVAQVGAGPHTGALFLPQVGDEVLVGFEHGDIRRPYVLGGLINNHTGYHRDGLGGPAVEGGLGTVTRRGFASPAGNRLVFVDQMPPGGDGPAVQSSIELGTAQRNMSLMIDQKTGTIGIKCMPVPPESDSPVGTINIECGEAGAINIMAGPGGRMTLNGGESLTLTAMQISIAAEAAISIEAGEGLTANAASIDLNSA